MYLVCTLFILSKQTRLSALDFILLLSHTFCFPRIDPPPIRNHYICTEIVTITSIYFP